MIPIEEQERVTSGETVRGMQISERRWREGFAEGFLVALILIIAMVGIWLAVRILGAAVRFVMNGQMESIRSQLISLKERGQRIVESIEGHLSSLAEP